MTTIEQRAAETFLDSELFGRRYWASLWESTQPKLIAVARDSDDVPSNRVEITPAEAATYRDIWNHNAYCSDWSLIPVLMAECEKRGWYSDTWHSTPLPDKWSVEFVFSDEPDDRWRRRGRADTLPMALCLAIIAVLDATADAEKARDE